MGAYVASNVELEVDGIVEATTVGMDNVVGAQFPPAC